MHLSRSESEQVLYLTVLLFRFGKLFYFLKLLVCIQIPLHYQKPNMYRLYMDLKNMRLLILIFIIISKKIIHLIFYRYLLFSQTEPENPGGQLHLNPIILFEVSFTQLPPFLQILVLLLHGDTLIFNN